MRFLHAHQSKPLIINTCDPGGARTLDPLIKSQLLYQLSYGVFFLKRLQRYDYFVVCQAFGDFFFDKKNEFAFAGVLIGYKTTKKGGFIKR